MPGFQSFFRFLHHFVLATLGTSSIRVKEGGVNYIVHFDVTVVHV